MKTLRFKTFWDKIQILVKTVKYVAKDMFENKTMILYSYITGAIKLRVKKEISNEFLE